MSLLPQIGQRTHRFCGGLLLAGVLTLLPWQQVHGASSAGPVRIIEAQGKVEVLRANFGVQAELLTSEADRKLGSFLASFFPVDTNVTELLLVPSSTREHLKYYERNLTFTLNQLIANEWSVGARYRLSDANLKRNLLDIPTSVGPRAQTEESATLHQVDLFTLFNHSSGFFSQFDALWSQQSNRHYTPDIPGDDFWQFNVFVGYRFPRRFAEVRLGVLNLTDQNYKLNPLNLTTDLPRDRTFLASLKFSF